MKYYLAPIEGVTGAIYRNAYHKHFGKIDKYFTPFIAPDKNGRFTTKELNDILPENNRGLVVIPQIISNKSSEFMQTANALHAYGYDEINLNLGCPSGTMVAKNKGSGFLAHRELLDLFLDEIFSQAKMNISIKTRLGKDDPEEFYELVKIFNKYPLKELIIHPRIQKDFYKNTPNLKVFKETYTTLKCPVCYNGDIFSVHDYNRFTAEFPDVDRMMFGRGVLSNPNLIRGISTGEVVDKSSIRSFHDTILIDYQKVLYGDHNVLYKMKEIWFYMIQLFADSSKIAKKIKKCTTLTDYLKIIDELFETHALID